VKSLAKRKANRNSKYWANKAMALWHNAVMAKWGGKCAVGVGCKGPLNCHHLVTRNIRHLRHDVRNGVVLCAWHHQFSPVLSAHGAPLAFAEWLRKHHDDIIAPLLADSRKIIRADYQGDYERLGGK